MYVCRDLDSRFSDREAAAVAEWLASDEAIHAMRDHPLHQTPLLGNQPIEVRCVMLCYKLCLSYV